MRHARLRSALPLLLGLLLLAGSLSAQQRPSQGRQQHNTERAQACDVGRYSGPGGLVVVIIDKPQNPKLDLAALENPCISGVALQIHWADLEPAQGKPEWSKLDQLFAAAKSSQKWVQLLIFPGFFSPEWALKGVKTETFPIQYGPGKGTEMQLPMPWNKTYLNRWFAFLKLLGQRYGKDSAFRVMAAAGPTSVSVEMMLPHQAGELKRWQADGYTPAKYKEAWQDVLGECAKDFPDQWISLSDGTALNINDKGKIDHGEGPRTRKEIVENALSLLGRRFVFQNSDLSGGTVRPKSSDFAKSYIGRAVVGLQMRTAAEKGSADMGAAGNPPLALRKSIDVGMAPNSAGQHINYLEIYEPDVLADEMQPVLHYGASLFGPQAKPPRDLGPKKPRKF